ncbi:P-loop containing nucleoside triphosphate hydrolase protein [Artomyces pyxidatus]|uniref:P-loop containing nucleoside triphosphate hydrolase protein n=1 Tax=Artomyces pyxidatus TaxID=48021 RepID=A0ACB8TDS0_9AGAM|nr:P-loop containing nucleoside triphosphate hydrolase protein [Artomyces pyxidatus]
MEPQVVLVVQPGITLAEDYSVWLRQSLAIPVYVAVVSALVLTARSLLLTVQLNKMRARVAATGDRDEPFLDPDANMASEFVSASGLKVHISNSGGFTIFCSRLARLLSVLGLVVLSVMTYLHDLKNCVVFELPGAEFERELRTNRLLLDIALCLTYVYASVLATLSITASSKTVATTAIRHVNVLLLSSFGVYAYRDLWPLATSVLSPVDQPEGVVLWVKIVLLAFASVVIPLTVPRQYIPYNIKEPALEPNPEQTASILSLALFTYLDPVVSMASTLPHLSIDDLPPLPDYDHVKNLVARSFKHLDVFSGAPKRHIFWGLMKIFGGEYIVMAALVLIKVASTFLGPIGLNGLLKYLETQGEGDVIHPWVWVSILLLSSLIGSLAQQQYQVFTGLLANRTEGFLIQLLFEHALRIRMKADATPDAASEVLVPPDGADFVTEDRHTAGNSATSESSQASQTPDRKGKQKAKSEAVSEAEPTPSGDSEAHNLVGKLNNLATVDLTNILDGECDILSLVLQVPLQISICIYFLYQYLGWSAFVGMVSMLILFPIPGKFAQLLQNLQQETANATDSRVQTVTDTLAVLRMIKLFGWEPKMADRLAGKRDIELRFVRRKEILNMLTGIVNYVIPVITMIVTFGTYTAIMKQELKPSIIFPSMAVFDLLAIQLHSVFGSIILMTQAKVSMDRITDFLQNTELLDEYTTSAEHVVIDEAHKEEIGFGRASFTWSNDDAVSGAETPSKRKFVLRIDGEVKFMKGSINLIVGPTGSGKTSLLMALLGEMHFIPSGNESWYNLPREGGVAYAAQESWVQNETIRHNILFGSPYDETRYNDVVYQCGLKRDLSLFDAGDKTEVGEKGLTLSGGQKARVTLARAIYSSAKIILLDDILAALDVHTARWIVEKCFKGYLVRDRTILLVTHNVALASPIADHVVSLGLNGTIAAHASVSDAIAKDENLKAELAMEVEKIAEDSKEIYAEEPDTAAKDMDGKLVMAEEVALGHVTMDSLKMFLDGVAGSYGGTGAVFWIIYVGSLLLYSIGMSGQAWWMGHWAEQYNLVADPLKVSTFFYLGMYIALLLASMTLYAVAAIMFITGSMRASNLIHRTLVQSILGTTLRWLDTTPVSRIITRCTQDIRALDGPIADSFQELAATCIGVLVNLAAIVYFTPVFLFPGIVVAYLGVHLAQVYLKAQMSAKRELSNVKAPVLGHFGAAITGLTSIRAYGAQLAFRQESYKLIDRNLKVGRTHYNLNRWISIRIDFLGALFSTGLAAYLIYGPNHENTIPSNTGFSLNTAIVFSSNVLFLVRMYNKFEVQCNSLERIKAYIDIEQEPTATKEGIPPAYWPASGDLKVENLSSRYSEGGPEVLHDLSFHIKSGERIGVVGRTGSGKSSLTLSLLRCIITEGNVYYDGLLTSSVNLDSLRSSITIIPQVPELLSGTLRENLDPFGQYDDATLNSALRAAGLFSLQVDNDDSRVTLDSAISSGGGNLSVGQRQILALARAIVRDSKLLILDEATSAIDYETDTVIQSSLRHELKSNVTLLTVAHRLQTIMDADKIMVLDAGRIVEFDKPGELLKKESGWFRSLVYESGDKDALISIVSSEQ